MPTINDLFNEAVTTHRERVALRMPVPKERKRGHGVRLVLNEITYGRLEEMVGRFASSLAELGVHKGDRVAVIAKPRVAWATSFFATLRLGATVVPLDPDLQPGEIERILTEAGVTAAIFAGGKAAELRTIKERSLSNMALISMDRTDEEGILFLDALLIGRKPTPPAAVAPEDLAVLMYTSGTTGNAKGAMLTHANIASNALSMVKVISLSSEDSFLSIVPWHHIYGLSVTLICPVTVGGATSYAPVDRNLSQVMLKSRPTILLGVPKLYHVLYGRIREGIKKGFLKRQIDRLYPTLMGRLLRRKLFGKQLRYFTSGGAPLRFDVAMGFRRLGLGILEGYGLTETAPLLTMCPAFADRPGMSPIEGVEIRVHEPDKNGIGEVLARGPNVMKGYYKNPEATAAVLEKDGWFHTGDLGRITPEGTLVLSGRAKNVIVLDTGENVYPEEVEWELQRIPEIEEVMVYEAERQGAPAVAAMVYPNWTALKAEKIATPEEALNAIWERIRSQSENLAVFKRIKAKDLVSLVDQPFEKSVKLDIKRFVYQKKP